MQNASDPSTSAMAPMKIGYLVPEFPSQTHIIFWREITCCAKGIEVVLLSTRRPAPGSCPHEFAAQAAAETHYVYPPPLLSCALTLAMRPSAHSAD